MTIVLLTLLSVAVLALSVAVGYTLWVIKHLKHDFALAISTISKLNPQDLASASGVAQVLQAHEHQFQLHANWQKEVTAFLTQQGTPFTTNQTIQ